MEHFEIWWEQINGPMSFLEDVKRHIENGLFCTALSVPGKLPWRYELLNILIKREVESRSKELIVIDGREANESPGALLFEHSADDRRKSDYKLCSHRMTHEAFLTQKGVLDDKVIWIGNASNPAAWKKHLHSKCYRDYRDSIGNHAVFVLESPLSETGREEEADALRYSDYVTEYDVHLFASIVAAECRIEGCLRRYITLAAENLYGVGAVETMVDFIHHIKNAGNFTDIDIVDVYARLAETAEDCALVKRKLWRAQTQVAFPVLEDERVKFIEDYRERLKHYLFMVRGNGEEEKEVNDVYDVELGPLAYLLGKHLNVRTRQEAERVKFLSKIRNDIAHLKCCSSGDMYRLLAGDENCQSITIS